MKRRSTAIICAAAAVCLLFCGCSEKDPDKTTHDIDPTQIVIQIGEESQNLAEFKALFDNYLPYMVYYGQDPLASEASLESYQDWLTDTVSEKLVTLYQAKLSGFTLSPEQEKELSEQTEAALSSAYDELMKFAEQAREDDPEGTVNTDFESIVNSESEYYTGTAMSWEDYKSYFIQQSRSNYMIEAYKEKAYAEFVPTEDDIAAWYDSAHKTDKENYTNAPEKYKTDEETYEQGNIGKDGAYPVTYVPNGYSRIMDIVVKPEGELSNDYNAKINRMNELKALYSELAFEDALNGSDAHKAELASLLSEYRSLMSVTAEEYSAYVAQAHDIIMRAYAELKSGKPFNEVMLRYTEDEAVTGTDGDGGCEAFRTAGRLISLDYDCENDWSDTVKTEFGKLKCGEYSGVFMDGDCYRIIFYSCDEQSGDVPMETLYEDIEAVCRISVQDRQWSALVSEWKNDPELYINEALIRTVGVDKLNEDD